ncbi:MULTISPECIES: hypothetical protein [Luteimonas]|uniref:hypothetical protein n=1 Tax=Luteimonas TaxID=83614 RepID=UPI00117EC923|nr:MULTISPECIES: hypothetical protein [Luteimonas]
MSGFPRPSGSPRLSRVAARSAALALMLTALLLGACAREAATPELVKPLHVDLATPVGEQLDLAWPRSGEALAAEHTIAQPRQVTLRLPNGKLLSTPSTRTTFRQEEGLLVSVNVTPDAGAEAQDAALRDIRALLDDNQLLDPTLARTLDGWALDGRGTQSTKLVVNDVDVMVALRQDPKTGWQTTLDFEPRGCGVPATLDGETELCLPTSPTETAVAAGSQG